MSMRSNESREHDTINTQIQLLADSDPNLPAFIFRGPEDRFVFSRRDVVDLSSRFAYRLTQHGVKPGDVVCIALPNCPERIVVEFGVHLAGAISMNGQVLRADGIDMLESLRKAKVKAMVMNLDQKAGAWKVIENYFSKSFEDDTFLKVTGQRVPTLKIIEICKFRFEENSFLESLKSEATFIYQDFKAADVVVIFTTSGSTGYSKLVMHTNKGILDIGSYFSNWLQLKGDGRFFSAAPLGWVGGFALLYLATGCTRVILDETVPVTEKTDLIWNVICDENISVAMMVPLQYMAIVNRPEIWKGRGTMLKRLLAGGQPFKKEHTSALGKVTHEIINAYGSTEAGIGHFVNVNKDNVSEYQDYSVGYAAEGFDVKIVDGDLKSLPRGTLGEILIRSPCLTPGYVESPEASSSFLPDGWFRTDDVGMLTDDGELVVQGRQSDAIMHGAYILYPFWLEEKLAKCPGVRQVVIVPVPDKILYHEICACVIVEESAALTPEDVIKFTKQEIILEETSSLTVVPKYVVMLDDFPTTLTGKLSRKNLAKLAASKLGL